MNDLNPEIERVRRELRVFEQRALARWRALPTPILTGQPQALQNTGTEAIETLGELMNYDQNISPNKNEACSFCNMPYAGFSGPIPSVNLTMIAYPGTVHFRAGKRTTIRTSLPLGSQRGPQHGTTPWRSSPASSVRNLSRKKNLQNMGRK
jgi:cytochrome c peroxidase